MNVVCRFTMLIFFFYHYNIGIAGSKEAISGDKIAVSKLQPQNCG